MKNSKSKLAATLIAACLLVGSGVQSANASTVLPDVDQSRATVVSYTNQLRAQVGAPPLVEDARLDEIAQAWAQIMADQKTLWHNPCINPQLMTITDIGGENIAMGKISNDQSVVTNQWRNSPGHYANIINGDYTHIGVGKAYSSDGVPFWVQDFSGELSSTPDTESFPAIRVACLQDIQDMYAETGTSAQPVSSVLPAASTTIPDPDEVTPADSDPSVDTTPSTPVIAPVVKLAKPKVVTGVKVSKIKASSATVKWVKAQAQYKVKRYTVRVLWKNMTIWQRSYTPKTSVAMTKLLKKASQRVQVRAENATGAGAWSKPIAFKTR